MVTVNELLALLVSVPLKVAVPLLVIVPATVTVTFTVTIMVCPPANEFRLQLTVPPFDPAAGLVQTPPSVDLTVLKRRLAGRTSVNTRLLAAWLWASLTCQV